MESYRHFIGTFAWLTSALVTLAIILIVGGLYRAAVGVLIPLIAAAAGHAVGWHAGRRDLIAKARQSARS